MCSVCVPFARTLLPMYVCMEERRSHLPHFQQHGGPHATCGIPPPLHKSMHTCHCKSFWQDMWTELGNGGEENQSYPHPTTCISLFNFFLLFFVCVSKLFDWLSLSLPEVVVCVPCRPSPRSLRRRKLFQKESLSLSHCSLPFLSLAFESGAGQWQPATPVVPVCLPAHPRDFHHTCVCMCGFIWWGKAWQFSWLLMCVLALMWCCVFVSPSPKAAICMVEPHSSETWHPWVVISQFDDDNTRSSPSLSSLVHIWFQK